MTVLLSSSGTRSSRARFCRRPARSGGAVVSGTYVGILMRRRCRFWLGAAVTVGAPVARARWLRWSGWRAGGASGARLSPSAAAPGGATRSWPARRARQQAAQPRGDHAESGAHRSRTNVLISHSLRCRYLEAVEIHRVLVQQLLLQASSTPSMTLSMIGCEFGHELAGCG